MRAGRTSGAAGDARRRQNRGCSGPAALAIAAVVTLVACGGDGGRAPTSAQDAARAPDLDQARAAVLAGDPRTATDAYSRALDALAERAGSGGDDDGLETARVTLGFGDARTLASAWKEARAAYEEVAASPDPRLAAAARVRLLWLDGRLAAERDRDEARRLFDQALAIVHDDRWIESRLVSSRAELASETADAVRVLPELERAAELARAEGDLAGEAKALRTRGQLEMELGRLEQAAESLAAARALLAHPSVLKSRILQDLGILHFHRREMMAALTSLRQAARLAADVPRVHANCLNLIGVVYGQQGNYPLARQALEQALATLEEHDDPFGQASTLENLAQLGVYFGRLEHARDYVTRLLSLPPHGAAPLERSQTFSLLGRLELAAGELDRAEEAFRRALALTEGGGEPAGVAIAYVRFGLGEVRLRRGDAAGALPLLRQGMDTLPRHVPGQVLIGRAERALGRGDDALRTLREAVRATEEQMTRVTGGAQDQELFLDRGFDAYGELIDLLAERGEVAAALAWAERARARSLLAARHDDDTSPSASERAEHEILERRLEELNRRRLELRVAAEPGGDEEARVDAELQRARLELETLHHDLETRRGGPRLLWASDPRRLQNLEALRLPADVLFLEFVVLGSKTLLFALRGDDGGGEPREPTLIEIPAGADELAGLTEAFRRRLAGRGPGYEWPARRLYELLIAPVEPLLDDVRRLGFAPDGPLWDVPLQVLGPRTDKVLAERLATFTVPSLGYLTAIREWRAARGGRHDDSGSILAVGDPAFSAAAGSLVGTVRGFDALGRLPDAEREAREVAALYGPGGVVLVGDAATETRIKTDAGRFRVLHFAAHALLDDLNPSFSALLLAPGDPAADGGEDGLLETWEIARLGLDADLAVLAGCQTHRGRLASSGRGLRGLSWAFARAGVPAVLASHWEVDSAATRLLMVELHRRLRAGEDAPSALRGAALTLRREERFQHPFYWAAFTLVGDPG